MVKNVETCYFKLNAAKLEFRYVNLQGENNNVLGIVAERKESFGGFDVTYKGGEINDLTFVSLFDIVDEIRNLFYNAKNKQITFVYHITDKPLDMDGCNEILVYKVLGIPRVDIYHRYSDLTGYLWTEMSIKDSKGHDVYEEILETVNSYITKTLKYNGMDSNKKLKDNPLYLTLEVEEH